MAMSWELVIGLETHAQLTTASKIFSGASTAFGAAPNSQASTVDLALPGTLPVLNRGAVERAIKFGLAIGAQVAPRSIFARKNYFYPDLPKGYQISQYEIPVVQGGALGVVVQPRRGDAYLKTIRLTRAHLEEDAGKSLHEDFHGMSGIDLNRAGVPLLEIVTEPDMRSAAEAVAYAKALHSLVVWLGICDGNMQEGSFRCDANVSVRPAGDTRLGTRCEIKNLNSFRFLERAIEFEARRQIELIEDGGHVVQETRLYDPDRDETRSMRSKEDAMDYRYFPDPDLLPLAISPEWVEQARKGMPELPAAMRERFTREYGLSQYDAQTLTSGKGIASYFEAVARAIEDSKLAANWVIGEVSAAVNEEGIGFDAAKVDPAHLAEILRRVLDGTLNAKGARELFSQMWAGKYRLKAEAGSYAASLGKVIAELGLEQISDVTAIEKIVDEVLAANQRSVDEFRAGKEKAFNALVGQAMKATKGKANPQQVNDLLRRKLSA